MNKSIYDTTQAVKLEKDNFYYSKDGLIIFTEKYHLKRGYCCESKCKHCPYGFTKWYWFKFKTCHILKN